MKKKRKIKVKKLIFVILMVIIIIFGSYYMVSNFLGDKETTKTKVVENEIKEYGYTLNEHETKLFKSLFNSLKTTLNASSVDEEEYASTISKLFVATFYNLDNKLSNGDIGGTQFIHLDAKDNFILKAQDTIYKYVESDIAGKRNQELPIVTNIEVDGIYNKSFEYGKKKDKNAYEVKLTWEYKEDLGYPTEATIILVHETESKLSIVELD